MAEKDPLQNKIQEYMEKAKGVLQYCEVKDERKAEIVAKMEEYINLKDRKLSEITGHGDEKRLINDAIHGPIKLTPLIFQMINTEEFHRLKYLRQQGGTHYVYPGANHTRFEHSIGVYHIAGVFARSLKQQLERDGHNAEDKDRELYKFEDEEILCAEIAGLCHDLGHGPMSHMFESVMEETLKHEVEHEKISVSMFKRLLTHPEVLGEFVTIENITWKHARLIAHMMDPLSLPEKKRQKDRRPFRYEIVANKCTGIDVDKWDYYQRDCHYLGILQDFEWKRTMLLGRVVMTPSDKKLHVGFREKEIDNLYGMFRTRANMYRKACKHKTVKAVERMFIDAMVCVQDLPIVWAPVADSDTGSSDEDSKCFKSIKKAIKLATEEQQLDWYMSMTDSIVDIIRSASVADPDSKTKLAEAKQLLKRLAQRDIYKCVAKIRVAKFGPLVEKMEKKHKDDNDVEVRTAQYLIKKLENRQNFGECVYRKLLQKGQTNFKLEHLLVEVIRIKHPSEGEENPLDKVVIFKKPKDPDSLPRVLGYEEAQKEVSMVMVPQAFVEYEVRVYDTCCKDERSKQIIDHSKVQTAMENAWEELMGEIKMDEEKSKTESTKSKPDDESPTFSQGSGTGSQPMKRKCTESISDDNSECPAKKTKK